MRDPASWVGMLSCGHTIGSVFRPADDDQPLVPARPPAYQGMFAQPEAAQPAKPPPPAHHGAPEIGALVLCSQHPCEREGRYVVDVVENLDQQQANLAEKRARK